MTLNLVGLKVESLDIGDIQSGVVLYDVIIFVDRKELPLITNSLDGNFYIDRSYTVKDNIKLDERNKKALDENQELFFC